MKPQTTQTNNNDHNNNTTQNHTTVTNAKQIQIWKKNKHTLKLTSNKTKKIKKNIENKPSNNNQKTMHMYNAITII